MYTNVIDCFSIMVRRGVGHVRCICNDHYKRHNRAWYLRLVIADNCALLRYYFNEVFKTKNVFGVDDGNVKTPYFSRLFMKNA